MDHTRGLGQTVCILRAYFVVVLAIHRSRVRVLAWNHRVVALGKLLTPVCLCQKQKAV